MPEPVSAVVFDIGKVLVEWDLRCLFRKLIADTDELEWFVANVVTEQWHYQVDQGRPLAQIVAERIAEFPEHQGLIEAYATRYTETIPGPVPGSIALVEALHANRVPLFAITNFGAEFWEQFRPQWPVLELFGDIVVSGVEKLHKPTTIRRTPPPPKAAAGRSIISPMRSAWSRTCGRGACWVRARWVSFPVRSG